MIEYLLVFSLGVVVSYFFTYVMSLGHSVNILKTTQRSCSALFIVSEQGIQEILHLKYIAMKESGRSQQNITSQKYIDQMSLDSVRKTIMRNYTRSFPESYSHLMEYTSWEEMVDWVNKEIKQGKKIS